MATVLAVGSMIFPASAANCAFGKIYSDYLNGTGEKGAFTVYTGGRVTTETSDTRPLYGMVTPSSTGYISEVDVWFTYYHVYQFTYFNSAVGNASAIDSYARSVTYCDYNDANMRDKDPLDARARFWINNYTTTEDNEIVKGNLAAYGQICSHFNDDTIGPCSHGDTCPYNIVGNWTTAR